MFGDDPDIATRQHKETILTKVKAIMLGENSILSRYTISSDIWFVGFVKNTKSSLDCYVMWSRLFKIGLILFF